MMKRMNKSKVKDTVEKIENEAVDIASPDILNYQ